MDNIYTNDYPQSNGSILVKLAIFTLGALAGFFGAKKVYKEHYANLAQEEIDNVKEVFNKRRKMRVVPRKENGMTDEEYEEQQDKAQDERTNKNPLTRSSLDSNPYEQAKKNYNLVGQGQVDDTVTTEVTDMDTGSTLEPVVDNARPYIIDGRDFIEDFDHHDKVSLYYYKGDDVLCHDHEAIVENVEECVGSDLLLGIDDQATIWVRNEKLGIDYEIITLNDSYAKSVHGIGIDENLSPRELYERKMRRRNRDGTEE